MVVWHDKYVARRFVGNDLGLTSRSVMICGELCNFGGEYNALALLFGSLANVTISSLRFRRGHRRGTSHCSLV